MKILGVGDLSKKLAVTAHGFSATAREKIEAAGGTVTALRGEPVERKPKKQRSKPAPEAEQDEPVEAEAVGRGSGRRGRRRRRDAEDEG